MRYVVLGNSAAGLTAIDAIRERDRDSAIAVVSKEPEPAYSRVALPYLLSREKQLSQVTLQSPEYHDANGVELIAGVGASAVDTKAKTVSMNDGRSLPYDRLLIATGSASRVPPIEGIEDAGVCYHWTLADTRKIEAQMQGAKSCFVIGAGFISLLTVSALIKVADLKYTVVEIADQVMPQLLDAEGGAALERAMREKGTDLLLGEQVAAIERGRSSYGITLKGGKTLDADMIVCRARL